MPLERPTLDTLVTRVTGDIVGRDKGRGFLKRAAETIFGHVIAGVAHGVYGAIEYEGDQLFPTRSELDGLKRWGVPLELPQLGGARASGGRVRLTGTPGKKVDEGTHYLTPSGAVIVTRATVTIAGGGTVDVDVQALLPGTDGNLEAGETIAAETSIDGVDDEAELLVPLTGGTPIEDTENYRGRILGELRKPKRRGGRGDYRAWALELEGVTRAWEWAHRAGVGTVAVAWVYDGRPNIMPTPSDVVAMQAHLDSKRPLDMRAVYAIPPVPRPVNLTIALTPPSATVADQVQAQLAALFRETELGGAPDSANAGALAQSVIDEAISAAPGETSHVITALSPLTPGAWELLTLGTVTTDAL